MAGKEKRGIDSLTNADIVGFRDSEAKRTKPTTSNDKLRIIKVGLARAFKDSHSKENLAGRIDFLKVEQTVSRSFTQDELHAVLGAATGEMKGLILFALYTGQRLGDLARLTWDCISDEVLSFSQTKTGRVMLLPLARPLVDYLRYELPANDDPKSPFHFQEPSKWRRLIRPSDRSRWSSGLCLYLSSLPRQSSASRPKTADRESGKLSFHSLRHNTVSMLKNAGVGEAVAMMIAGHASKEVSRLYPHIFRRTQRGSRPVAELRRTKMKTLKNEPPS